MKAGHPGAQALPAPGTPKGHLLSGHAGAISPTMSHNSPVGAITRLPSQKELQEELERAKARRVAATDDEERGFYDARVAKIESQITCAMSSGHRLDIARKQREEAVKKLTANFKHLQVAQDNCARANLKYREADEYYNKVREETAGIDIPAQVPDANIAGMLQSFLSLVLPCISSTGQIQGNLSQEQLLEIQKSLMPQQQRRYSRPYQPQQLHMPIRV